MYKSGGFSLLEVLIAFSVIVVALLGVYSIFINVQVLKQSNSENQLATLAAHTKMEEILATDWEEIPALDGEEIQVEGLQHPSEQNHNGVVEIDTSFMQQNILVVIIAIEWKSFNKKRTIKLSTFVEK